MLPCNITATVKTIEFATITIYKYTIMQGGGNEIYTTAQRLKYQRFDFQTVGSSSEKFGNQ